MKEEALISKIITCKICNKDKDAFNAGHYKSKGYKYVDVHGKAFNGKICPTCHVDYMAAYQKLKRVKPDGK